MKLSRRYTRKHRRFRRPSLGKVEVAVRGVALGLLFSAGIMLAEQAGFAAASAATAVQDTIAQILPLAPVTSRPGATTGPALVSGAPILDSLPTHTNEARLTVSGRLPPHIASSSDRPRVEILVNGGLVAVPPIDAQGRFSAAVTLVAGPNVIAAVAARVGERVEGLHSNVVLDTTPPTLSITRPANGAQIDGPTVVVEGRSEKDASITVNGHAVAANPDGAFADTLQASPGQLVIEVVARDLAGNETRRSIVVTVRQTSAVAGLTVTVSLDRTSVSRGQRVNADVVVSHEGRPVRNALVTVYVGRFTAGSGTTDSAGRLGVSFSAPAQGFYQVVALATADQQTGSGSASLEVR